VADNSSALRRARRRDSSTKRDRATTTLQTMIEAGEIISFPAVARRAAVSVSLLYADPGLAAQIAAARDRQRQAGRDRAWRLPTHSLVTDQSLRAELANTKDQARRLAEEVMVLRDRLARHLGTEADLARGRVAAPLVEQLEERAAELEADNARLRQRVTDLEHELAELGETLDAARAMNRELMSELNSSTPRPSDQAPARSSRRHE